RSDRRIPPGVHVKRLACAILFFVLVCDASTRTHAAPPVERQPDGIVVPVAGGLLRIQIKTDAVVRVLFSKVRDPRVDPWVVVGPSTPPTPGWTLRSTASTATLATSKLKVTVSLDDGAVTFADSTGRPILAESGRRLTPAAVQAEATFNVQQSWKPN